MKFHPSKIQNLQELKPADSERRLNFVNEMVDAFTNFNNIIFYNEVLPYLSTRSHFTHQRLWFGLESLDGVSLGHLSLKKNRSQKVTVNSERHIVMLKDLLAAKLQQSRGDNRNTNIVSMRVARNILIYFLRNWFLGDVTHNGARGELIWFQQTFFMGTP